MRLRVTAGVVTFHTLRAGAPKNISSKADFIRRLNRMIKKTFTEIRARVVRRWEQLKAFYQRHEKYAPVAAFAIGFIYDSLTLTRIDQWLDNAILLLYTVLAGALLTILGMAERNRIRRPFILNHLDLFATALHFLLGGLLSSYVVFYFKSASVGKSFIFVCLLVALLLINEFFAHRLRRLKFLFAIYFFCCFAFLTFFLPVVTRSLSQAMFLTSGALSLLITGGIAALIYDGSFRRHRRELKEIGWPPGVVFITLVVFYYQNWIPPVPLALKEDGIYRSVRRVDDQYELKFAAPRWWQFWKNDEKNFAYSPGDTVYCFASVFAPTKLRERILHHWQIKSASGKWQTTDNLSYSIVGGRDGGYRGYTYKKNFAPQTAPGGKEQWRVEVKTANGLLLGRINFQVRAREGGLPQMATVFR